MPFRIFLVCLTLVMIAAGAIAAIPAVAANIGDTSATIALPTTWMVYASLISTLLSGLANFVPRTSLLGKIIWYGALNIRLQKQQ